MANWDPQHPRTLRELTQGLLEGDKPETLKSDDEYGRSPDLLEEPANVRKRIKESE